MNVGCDPGLPNERNKWYEAIKAGEAGLANRTVLEEDNRRIRACLFERLE